MAWISPRPAGGGAVRRSTERSPVSSSSAAPMTWAIVEFWRMFTRRPTSGGKQPAERLREDHERVPPDPAEAERRGGLVLLAGNGLDGAPGRFCDLGAAPERQADRRRREGVEAKVRAHRRQREVDDEDGYEDGQPAADLDVETDEGLGRPEADRQQRSERDPDQRAAHEREAGDAEGAGNTDLPHVARDRLDPLGQVHRASLGRARRASSSRMLADSDQTSAR